MTTDLSLVSMDEIIIELDKRFDTVCLLTKKILNKDVEDLNYHYQDKIGCLGMIKLAEEGIKNDYEPRDKKGFQERGLP